MTPLILRRVAAALLAPLALAACGHSAPIRFYTLESAAPATPPHNLYAGSILYLEAVRLPAALDRMELMSEVAPGELRVREFERWAAPPARLVRGALHDDLSARLPAGRIQLLDARPAPAARRLSVNIVSVHHGAGVATLSAAWTFACPNDRDPTPSTIDLQSQDIGHQSTTTSLLLGRLADAIVAQLEASPQQVCAPAPERSVRMQSESILTKQRR